MIQARGFGALLALGALTALPGCSYFGMGGGGGQQYGSSAPSTQYTAPASREAAEAGANRGGTVSNVQQPITTAMVRRVQAQLKHDGLYHGRIDGRWGPRSQHAAAEFQHRNNLQPTGKIDLPMLQAMNLTSGNEQYGESNGMGPNGNAGPNGQMGNQQYGEANGGSNMGGPNGNTGPNSGMNNGPNGMRNGANQNYTTGSQNASGTGHASNAPYNDNNAGAPNDNMNNGNMNNGGATNTNQPSSNNGAAPQR